MQLEWKCKHFDELTAKELYKILRLRSEVFVVEQNCVYLDIDNKDLESYHLAGYDGKDLVAYARLLAPGVAFKEASIGRVATHPTFRKTGAGKQLLTQAIDACLILFPTKEIKIGAQLYLKKFYTDFGFTQSSELYLEDGIPHIEMILRK
ncbi:MAG: GNAT family N-acetyltransferase [Ferruginibacter sp.]